MNMKFAGFEYEERIISLDLIDENDSQPASRNDLSDPKRQRLMKSMEQHGLKDRVDVVTNGPRFIVVEGHGRVMAARVLGWKTIAAKVYATTERMAEIRNAIFEANDTVKKMTGAAWTEYIFLEQEKGQLDVKGLSKAIDLVNFLRDNFSPPEVRDYITVKNVGPDSLAAARRYVRESQGTGNRGPIPAEYNHQIAQALRWVVKHGMTRAVIDHFKDGKGHRAVTNAIEADRPLAKPRQVQPKRDSPMRELDLIQ